MSGNSKFVGDAKNISAQFASIDASYWRDPERCPECAQPQVRQDEIERIKRVRVSYQQAQIGGFAGADLRRDGNAFKVEIREPNLKPLHGDFARGRAAYREIQWAWAVMTGRRTQRGVKADDRVVYAEVPKPTADGVEAIRSITGAVNGTDYKVPLQSEAPTPDTWGEDGI